MQLTPFCCAAAGGLAATSSPHSSIHTVRPAPQPVPAERLESPLRDVIAEIKASRDGRTACPTAGHITLIRPASASSVQTKPL